ncbi:hypothetical protein [Sphingosinicella sp. BN140058]|uniref:hypothetical protein n=1 Tax=Sphingosinicella sp. BN140058 TaxID=1892855 RepID=UPI0010108279|nr:hypothetical protein [Sphingosinicella sp. BN140058]QAY76993.1 hypothetical protein ETR14_11145 [Sphingosinicella sp. BN140058]
MSQFGRARFIGLSDTPEAGIKSYRTQVAEGTRRDGPLTRMRYLADANVAYNYIWWLRTRSNDPAYVRRLGRWERKLRQPLASLGPLSERAEQFLASDFHFETQMLKPDLVQGFAADLFNHGVYHDPYVDTFRHVGSPDDSRHPFLYMGSQALFENANFLEICSSRRLIHFCREVLGPRAALSWAWSWISQPTTDAYQNQNWHRDCAEPLNFIRVFVPLQPIETPDDGPTELIPGTSGLREFYDVRRFSDPELEQVKIERGAGKVYAEPGDVYFVNTFALHRGTPPQRRRAILTLLVSLSPSHRTPSIHRFALADVPERLRPAIDENRAFFRHLIR